MVMLYKKWKNEKWLTIIAIFAILFLVPIMFVPLVKYTMVWKYAGSLEAVDTGRSILLYGNDEYSEIIVNLVSVFMIASWVLPAILIGLIILARVKMWDNENTIVFASIATTFLFTVIYMVLGFIITNNFMEFYKNPYEIVVKNVYTLSYIPAILQLVFLGLGTIFFINIKKAIKSPDLVGEIKTVKDHSRASKSNLVAKRDISKKGKWKNEKITTFISIISIVLITAIIFVPITNYDIYINDTLYGIDHNRGMAIYGYDLLFTNPSVIVGGFKVVSIIFAWVIFVTTIAMIVGLILSFTKLKNTKAQKIMQLVVVGSACTCAFFYMIVGILSTVGVDKYHDFSTYYQYGYYWTTTTEAINEFTIAYIPLILQAVCLVFVLVNFFKNRKELVCVKNSEETIVANETLTNTPNQKIVSTVNASIIEDIKKFKELLDMGAITQEEYDAKKKELLGL